jgi:putative colanic acid biosynthesis UDP-glucose lipid carrier transferase
VLNQSRQIQSQRSLLQRRKSLTTTLQSMIDGIIVLATVYFSLLYFQSYISTFDAIFMVTLLIMMGVTYDQMGIYRQYRGLINATRKLLFAWSISFAITIFIFILINYFDQISRPALTAIFIVSFGGQLLNRWLLVFFRDQSIRSGVENHPVLLVGDGSLTKYLYDKINSNPWIQERAIGRIQICNLTDDIAVPILGQKENIIEVVRQYKVKRVYISVSLANSHLVEDIYYDLINENVDIHWAPNIFSMELVNHSVKEMAGIPLLTLSESPLIGNHRLFKAVEDRLIALILLVLLSPLFIITAILIKLDSPGPVIFRQDRTGWNGRVFHIWKFRSMRVHKEPDGEVKQATKDDDRFTPIGKFIRKTSIDELPQLFNVLSGKMSLVGPRPHAIQHNEDYAKRISAYLTRHRIKPGITGLAQIHGYRGETDTLDKMEKRVEYDLQYINSWSFWLDIEILLKTLPAMLRDGAF